MFLRESYPVILTFSIGTMGVLHYALSPAVAEQAGGNDEAIDSAAKAKHLSNGTGEKRRPPQQNKKTEDDDEEEDAGNNDDGDDEADGEDDN